MIPEPSRRPFGYPLPVEALPYFLRPESRGPRTRPYRDAGGNLVCWNGGLAIRIRSYLTEDEIDIDPTPWEAVENSLHWPGEDAHLDAPEEWKSLDEESGRIWRYGPKPVWLQLRDGFAPAKFTTVRVGAERVVPLGLLQLCARLPRCRVCIVNSAEGHLQLTWNGGEAVIKPMPDLPASRFAIHTPRRHWLTDRLQLEPGPKGNWGTRPPDQPE